jgi:tetratricopeptide (TPR) repeat protein
MRKAIGNPGWWLVVWWLAGGWVLAAAGDSAAEKLRTAIRLPTVELGFKFGFSQSQSWHGDDEVVDPRLDVERLRKELRGEPADAPILLRMAEITARIGDPELTTTSVEAAVTAHRRWLESAPMNPLIRAGLASSLRQAGRLDEAEKVLETSDGMGPGQADVLREWASVHEARALMIWNQGTNLGISAVASGAPPPPVEVVEAARRRLVQAEEALTEAIRLRPDDARLLARRAQTLSLRAVLELGAGPVRAGEDRRQTWFAVFFPTNALPDMRAAVRLRPSDPRLIAANIYYECMTMAARLAGQAEPGEDPRALLGYLDGAARERVLELLDRLERLGSSDDRRLAASALENLAPLRILTTGSMEQAGAAALRAFRLDSARGQAFDLALGDLVNRREPNWGLAEELVRERLRFRRDERLLLILAKIEERRGNLDTALATVREAMKLRAEAPALLLAEYCLRLKQGEFPDKADPAPEIRKIRNAIDQESSLEEQRALVRIYFLTLVATSALGGDVETAKPKLREYISQNPTDEYAQELDRLIRALPTE